MSRMRIGLFGNFGTGNLGNEASLRAMLEQLRRNRLDSDVTVICYDTVTVEREHHVKALSIGFVPRGDLKWLGSSKWLKFPLKTGDVMRAVIMARQFDVLLVPGTGILDDFQENWYQAPLHLWMWSFAAWINRRVFALVSIGAGPISGSLSAKFLLGAAAMAGFRSYRDEMSKSFMIERGMPAGRDTVSADLAFLLSPPAPRRSEATTRTTIGVGLMSYRGWGRSNSDGLEISDHYLEKMVSFCCWLLDRGHRIRFLIGERSDIAYVGDVVERIRARRGQLTDEEFIAEEATSLEALMVQMAGAEVIVATRYHNVVAALLMSKPVLSINYAQKNGVLLADAGLDEFQQHIETFDVDLLINQFERLMAKRGELAASMQAAVTEYRRRLQQQERDLYLRLGNG